MQEYQKCVVITDGPKELRPCKWMQELVGRTHSNAGGGISVRHLVNMKTHEPTREAWAIHSGKHNKKGVHMNFCPMCGASLRGLFAHLFEDEPADNAP